jgi:hypothetical protein
MVTAEHGIDGEIWKVFSCSEASIDDACMRARGDYGYPSAWHTGRDEALIHDQWIRRAVLPAKAVVTDETSLVAGYTIDLTAPKEKAATDGMGIIAGDHLAPGLRDAFESGLLRQHNHQPVRQQDAALIRPIWMKIDNRPGMPCIQPRLRDGSDDFRKTATVVEMPVRQKNALDCREVNPKTSCIVKPKAGIWADIKQHAVLLFASAAGEQHRKPMTGAAQLIEYSLALVPVVAATLRKPPGKMDDFGYLGHTFVNTRQRISFVVDNDQDLQFV